MHPLKQAMERSLAWRKSGDLPKAIACLEAARSEPDFFPAAAIQLMGLKQAARDWSGAKALADDVLQHEPHSMAAWTIRLSHHQPRLREETARPIHWQDFLETLRRAPDLRGRALRSAVLEALLRTRPADWQMLATKATTGDLLLDGDAQVLGQAIPFLAAIADLSQSLGGPGLPWSLGLQPWPEACRADAGTIRVNSGWFRDTDPSLGWDSAVCTLIAQQLGAVLGLDFLRDQVDFTSAAAIGRPDFAATLVEMSLIVLLRDGAGLNRDVRDCARPAPFAPGALILRTGRCELWALTTWLLDPREQLLAAERVAVRAQETAQSGEGFENWRSVQHRLNADENCNSLSCNAGWYARPGRAGPAFADWAGRYLAAMDAGALLAECAEDMQRIATLRPATAARALHGWDDNAFAQAISGKHVVFVTAFAEPMLTHFASGRLAALWRQAGLPPPPRSLRTVAAPMSVWPYMPDQDWSETFHRIAAKTAQAVVNPQSTVLLASCGCYGLPLVHAMHSRFPGLTAIYNGHPLNAWFGILTNDALNSPLYRRAPDPALWQVVELAARFPGLARIDEGRYAADRVGAGRGETTAPPEIEKPPA